jgi:hypothetical protein
MAYLPDELLKARVLITVKTYPLPSRSYPELVCTAGLLNGEQWIRIYPVSYRLFQDDEKFPKYSWVELNLVRNSNDFRPESYHPKLGIDERITIMDKIGTGSAHDWAGRKSYVLKETFTSMSELIQLAKSSKQKSLATLKPTRIVDFIDKEVEREWKQDWLDQLKQLNMFDIPIKGGQRKIVKKLPYKFSYRFFTEGDKEPRTLMIEDWEIGTLFWNCLNRAEGDEQAALQLVRQKYFDEFIEKDLYLFVGTTLKYHNVATNPFVIIGVFYPPKINQLSLL